MAFSLSARLGLKRPLAGHGFSRQEHYDNLSVLDQFPGLYVCTSGTRPSWGAAHTGMRIWETDRNLEWRWDGSAFKRVHPIGLLGVSDITSDFSTAATTPTPAASINVTIPATHAGSTTKRIEIAASWYAIENGTDATLGVAEVAIVRDPSTVVRVMAVRGRTVLDPDELDRPVGGTIVAWDDPPAGAATYHLAINSVPSVGGNTVLKASPAAPAQIAVKEVGL